MLGTASSPGRRAHETATPNTAPKRRSDRLGPGRRCGAGGVDGCLVGVGVENIFFCISFVVIFLMSSLVFLALVSCFDFVWLLCWLLACFPTQPQQIQTLAEAQRLWWHRRRLWIGETKSVGAMGCFLWYVVYCLLVVFYIVGCVQRFSMSLLKVCVSMFV